jgi:hypothetical protein
MINLNLKVLIRPQFDEINGTDSDPALTMGTAGVQTVICEPIGHVICLTAALKIVTLEIRQMERERVKRE